jgi:hypothetical protein
MESDSAHGEQLADVGTVFNAVFHRVNSGQYGA